MLGHKWIIEKIKTPNLRPKQCDGCGTVPCLDLNPVELLWSEVESSFKCSEEGLRCSGFLKFFAYVH